MVRAVSDDSVVLWSRSVLLPVALAIIAAEGGSHGYRIKQLMEQSGFQRPVDGALYPMLRTAEAEGLLESSWQKGERKPDRLVCRITPAGMRRLTSERDKWATFANDVDLILQRGTSAGPPADESGRSA